MKKRVITGIVYVIVMAGLLVMKLLIPATDGVEYGALGIDLLFTLIAVCGSYEFTRALGLHGAAEDGAGNISPVQRTLAIVTCSCSVPLFVIIKMLSIKKFAQTGGAVFVGESAMIAIMALLSVGAMVTASMIVFDHDRSDLKSTAYSLLCILYCGALVLVGPNINHMVKNSDIAIVFLFILVPFVDSFAFFFGMAFGRFLPYKLAPKTSPNKTIIGAVGGIIGGVIASVIVWVLSEYTSVMPFDYSGSVPKVVVLMLISLPASLLSQLGDLFESAIKRSCGIKDMGKILPGHGGVLDRFDSMLFASVAVVVCFMLV